jgi:DNA adenine methylase
MVLAIKQAARAPEKLFKWAGGKGWLSPRLAALYAPYRDTHLWTEWFCGSLGATLGVAPKVALLNDVNPYAIWFYRYVASVGRIPEAFRDVFLVYDRERYYENRTEFNRLRHSTNVYDKGKAAILFYYLNRSCFNGLARFNSAGDFNVPFGRHASVNYRIDFSHEQKLFRSWEFSAKDWTEMAPGRQQFIYIDPPYDGNAAAFTTYFGKKFSWEEQVALCDRLADLPNPVAASNLATDRIVELYRDRGFDVQFVEALRSISCKAGGRSKVMEILALKNIA